MPPQTLQAARWMTEQRGFSLIPLDHPADTNQTDPKRIGKVPRLPAWKAYQDRRPTTDELQAWFGNGHPRNVGIVTGAISGIVVVDCDSPEALAWVDAHLPDTPMRTRTANGEHRMFRHPGVTVPNKVKLRTDDDHLDLDVRADGGFVVGPGSVHRSGVVYERVGSWPPVSELPEFRPEWLALDTPSAETAPPAPPRPARPTDDHARVLDRARAYLAAMPGAVEGHGGDVHTLKAACHMVRGFDLSDADALDLLREWNARCSPPWSEEDLARKVQSARKYGKEPIGGLLDAARPAVAVRVSSNGSRHTGAHVAPEDHDDDHHENDPAVATSDDAEWVRDQKGVILANHLDNIRLGLARLDAHLTFDQFQRQVCLNGQPLEDAHVDRLWVAFDDTFGFRPSKEVLRTLLVVEADASPVHPIRAYLDGLTWDGTPRLDRWLVTYAGAVDTPYVQAVGALPLIAAVRRVRQPGAKFDELLVLESRQGTGKSSGLRALCPDENWFSDDLPLGVDAKVIVERTTGRWLIEAAELHGTRGKAVEQLKAFLSRQVDGPVRLAYGRLPVSVRRQFCIIGTTNARVGYLTDATGGRRFWPVTVGRFDLDALVRDRDQLWAEAAALEAAGASIRLDESLWDAATVEQEGRRAADPWEELLAPLLDGDGLTRPDRVPVAAIWDALKMEASHRDNRAADRVGSICQRHGFTRKRKVRVDGQPPAHYWERGEGTDAD
jgi:predicted P-loop ATPase